jgi:hypothetical protein
MIWSHLRWPRYISVSLFCRYLEVNNSLCRQGAIYLRIVKELESSEYRQEGLRSREFDRIIRLHDSCLRASTGINK